MATNKHRAHRPDPEASRKQQEQLTARLKRIEGQVRGIQRMVEEERYCGDVLTQISAIQESLRKVSEVLLRDHLRHCVTTALEGGDAHRKEEMFDELTGLFNKYAR
ncbi:MAG TPA: metal-sensitive transcriptional regulator [Thermoanaerobaculia bacterium]|jgi:DNA-binding FrmR family transcriptional regulator